MTFLCNTNREDMERCALIDENIRAAMEAERKFLADKEALAAYEKVEASSERFTQNGQTHRLPSQASRWLTR